LQAKTWSLTLWTFTIAPKINKNSTDAQKVSAIKAIQASYSWSNIASQENIAYILNQTSTGQIVALTDITLLKWQKNLTWNSSSNATPTTQPVSSNKTVADCWTSPWLNNWDVIYWTTTWWSWSLNCSDNIIVCNWTAWSWYTISACNLWATAVALSDNSNKTTSYWWLYQWWNHFDFRNNQFTSWNVYTTTGTTQVSSISDYSTYSTWTFIKVSDWTLLDSTWVLRSASWNPCPTNYHVPSHTEWVNLFTNSIWTSQVSYNNTNKLKMPVAGILIWNIATLYFLGILGYYWSSSPSGTYGYGLYFNSTAINSSNYDNRSSGFSIRCFKN